MNLNPVLQTLTTLPGRLRQRARGMFNLNDPRWGRDDDNKARPDDATPETGRDDVPSPPPARPPAPNRPQGQGPNQGPPDLDELWRDFNRKLGGLFGGAKNAGQRARGAGGGGGPGGPGGFQPDMKSAGIGVGLIAAVAVLIWLGTGFFIVQEGQQAVITQFGKYKSTVGAGFNWRLPYPVQRHELVVVTQIRSVDVGRDTVIKATGLRESAMLTEDENIVEIKFAVQYRLNDARAYLFESKDPAGAVVQAAETAVREVVGKMKMDSALAEERDQIGPRVRTLMQTILDRYKVGVEVVGINLQQSGVRPPEQVQASFDDVLKAGQERERAKNEAQAYANDVIPRAVGSASRLKEESEAYKARIVAQAQGDAQRFRSVLAEYQKAPQVTRDRMYTDTMQQVYSNVTKVMVESRQGSNLLYLPLDKIMQQSGGAAAPEPVSGSVPAPSQPAAPVTGQADTRARDASRTRDRDTR
ncbi:MAG: FtsH protease activity modulator HflK [Polaromonas sp.]|uniref:FtsH protease activity modulator HflK n=1 Tax=Polaromonas sp. TaxID=1869339 RepID=UPI00272F612C|nr:FtsH protease activity modulator HflK [Polaromonas sp.]MDP1742053.1 FtsH protease activity modulator HflK [Polaromonas sp.]MDP1952868.1 FtsH protease activity modulator HflK [Polaromonas sp.]MDP3356591.1 FtsH protease activity modulator HflK [Polaromonas sp.]MDP3755643.1 FtsH protease activity modulator HflK [Polaromonas sp.]